MNIWGLCQAIAQGIETTFGGSGVVVAADLRPTYDAQAIGGDTTIIVTPAEGEISVIARERLQYSDTIQVAFLAKVRRVDGGLDVDAVDDLLSLVDSTAQMLCRASYGEYVATGEITRGNDVTYYPDDIDARIFAAVLRATFMRTVSI